MSVWRAAAFPIAQLGVGAFFIAGVVAATLGNSAPWFVLGATALAVWLRAIDIESWAFLIPGGLVGRVTQAFGGRAARAAMAITLVERLLLGALASIVVGHYIADVVVMAIVGLRFEGSVAAEDLATLVAVAMIGSLWLRARIGRDFNRDIWTRAVWIGTGIVGLTMVVGVVTLARRGVPTAGLSWPALPTMTGRWLLDAALISILGFAQALPSVGGGESLARAAQEFPPPRVPRLRRTALLTLLLSLLLTTLGTFLFILLVPPPPSVWRGSTRPWLVLRSISPHPHGCAICCRLRWPAPLPWSCIRRRMQP